MTQHLHQVIAVEKSTKPRVETEVTKAFQRVLQAPLLSGIERTYRPKDEDGDRLPPESTKVQVRAEDVLVEIATSLTQLFDLTLTKDSGNQEAKGTIVVDGHTLLEDVPVTTLLFLEKKLVDLTTIINKLPVLDPAEEWLWDEATASYRTPPADVSRSKKVPRNHVLAQATDKHPAQVQMYMEDVQVGFWTTTKFSGALPQARINQLKARVVRLANAVKVAREQANSVDVSTRRMGDKIFGYLFVQ